jgi:hypothetical protein
LQQERAWRRGEKGEKPKKSTAYWLILIFGERRLLDEK